MLFEYAIKLLRASLYLYNPMVRRPWVDLYSQHYIIKIRADNPISLTNYALHAHKMWSLYIGVTKLTKIWALSPKTSLGGSRTQQSPNTNIMNHPRVTLSV